MTPVLIASLVVGAALTGAVILAVTMFRRPLPHLARTLTAVTGQGDPIIVTGADSHPEHLLDRWGTRLLRTGRFTPSRKQLAQLRLRNITIARFYGERAAAALLCMGMAAMLWWTAAQLGLSGGYAVPLAAAAAAAAFGWFLPALRIASSAHQVAEDASEALLVYIDLVILERMASRHARDALTAAAHVSGSPVFLNIQQALARAELEREQPWAELKRLAVKLELPQLNDVADIASLQEEGASLADAFRARVAEQRNAYVVQRQREADRITQRMEIPKILPVIVVAFTILLPPLLRIIS